MSFVPSTARVRVFPCSALSSIECCVGWPRVMSLGGISEKKVLNVAIPRACEGFYY